MAADTPSLSGVFFASMPRLSSTAITVFSIAGCSVARCKERARARPKSCVQLRFFTFLQRKKGAAHTYFQRVTHFQDLTVFHLR